jgi:acetylornithine deacetylase/succinyl-diaminopimelate desuccinylase-like protein
VPDQDVAEVSDLLRAWVAENLPDYVEHTLTVTETTRQAPYVTPPDHPALDVLAEAMGDAWGRPAGWMRNAGSAPAALLAEATGGPVLFFGTGLPEDGWHDSDESVHLGVLVNGAVTLGLFWDRVAGVLTPAGR